MPHVALRSATSQSVPPTWHCECVQTANDPRTHTLGVPPARELGLDGTWQSMDDPVATTHTPGSSVSSFHRRTDAQCRPRDGDSRLKRPPHTHTHPPPTHHTHRREPQVEQRHTPANLALPYLICGERALRDDHHEHATRNWLPLRHSPRMLFGPARTTATDNAPPAAGWHTTG